MCEAIRHTAEYLSIYAAAQAWHAGGGSDTNIVAAVAVAWTESVELNRFAISSDCALGLWQILEAHAAEYGFGVEQLYDVRINASIAVALSNDGSNWEAWDVAYAEGSNLRVRRYIAYPDVGSVAYAAIPMVAQALGLSGNGGGGGGGNTSGPTHAPNPGSGPRALIQGYSNPIPYQGPPSGPVLPSVPNPINQDDGWGNYAAFLTRDIVYLTQVDAQTVEDILHD